MSVAAPASPYRTAPRHFAWLLWLALLLPIGQMAAIFHAVSHLDRQTALQVEDGGGLPDTPCDLCLIAAAIGSGGLRGAPPTLPDLTASHEVPQAAFDSDWLPSPARAYLSRAPPFFVPH
ncbi:hypothetical protein [Azoarcus sp. KH32C]|uniref:hypothetical protein n=1 Tax=Azoarcus sp. KH32C TaxID=748247 RepID=UPI0002386565|nr:hypothetical protein [Azoarcus sp. KH32C]BAL26330.1 hypothetical protein AZKH_4050 [Azoarcus sp. KH32C]